MAVPKYPSDLLAAVWDKQKGLPAKDLGFSDALKKLGRLHDAVDLGLLDTAKLTESAVVEERLAAIRAQQKGRVKAVVDQAKAVALLARKLEAELKKNSAVAKPVLAATAKAASAADVYAGDIAQAFDTLIAALTKLLPKLAASQASEADGEQGEGDFRKFAAPRVVAALRMVKQNLPGAKPVQFMLVEGNLHACALLGVSVSPSSKNKLIELLKERGDSSFKTFQGECIWEENAYTFVGDNLPLGGLAKKLKEGLEDLTSVKYKLRLRKSSGEVEETEGEASEAEEDTAAADVSATSGGDKAAFNARLTTLQPKIVAGLAGPAAPDLKGLVARMKELAQQGDYSAAGKQLDRIRALLAGARADDGGATFTERLTGLQPDIMEAISRAGPRAAALKIKVVEATSLAKERRYEQGLAVLDQIEQLLRPAPQGARQAGNAASGFDEPRFRKRWAAVKDKWRDGVETVNAQIDKLQTALKSTDDEDLHEIADMGLPALTGNLKTPMMAAIVDVDAAKGEALKAAADRAGAIAGRFSDYLDKEPRVQATDANEYGVPVAIRSTLGPALREMRAVLAEVA